MTDGGEVGYMQSWEDVNHHPSLLTPTTYHLSHIIIINHHRPPHSTPTLSLTTSLSLSPSHSHPTPTHSQAQFEQFRNLVDASPPGTALLTKPFVADKTFETIKSMELQRLERIEADRRVQMRLEEGRGVDNHGGKLTIGGDTMGRFVD